jgi:hypothetical protein
MVLFLKAEYFKGIRDSWDEVSKQKEMSEFLKNLKKIQQKS